MAEFEFKTPGSSGGGGKKPSLKKLTSKPMLFGIIGVALLAIIMKSRGSSNGISEDEYAGYPILPSAGAGGSSGVDYDTFQQAIANLKELDEEKTKLMQDSFAEQMGKLTTDFTNQMNSMQQMYQNNQSYYQNTINSLRDQMGQIYSSNRVFQPSQPSYNDYSAPVNSYYTPTYTAPSGNYSGMQVGEQYLYRDQMDNYLNEKNGTRQDLIQDAINTGNWQSYREFDAYHDPSGYYRDTSTGNLERTQAYWQDYAKTQEKMLAEYERDGTINTDPWAQRIKEDLQDTYNRIQSAKK